MLQPSLIPPESRHAHGRSKFESPCLLRLRDCENRSERFLCRPCVRRIMPEQDLAADAIGFRLEPTLSVALGLAKDGIDGGKSAFDFARLCLRLRSAVIKSGMKKPVSQPAAGGDSVTHIL